MRRLLVLVSLLVVFFGSATVAADQGKVVTIADNVVLAGGGTIDFPAVDVRLVSDVSLLGKTTGNGVSLVVKFTTTPGLFGDFLPATGLPGGASCFIDPSTGLNCGAALPLRVAGPFMLIRAFSGCSACSTMTFSLDAYLVK